MTVRRARKDTKQRAGTVEPVTRAEPVADAIETAAPDGVTAERLASAPVVPTRSPEEAEERYVAARTEWTTAMRAAGNGRPADLARLAVTQEAFEAAALERELWTNGTRVAIPIEPERRPRNMDAIVGQELAWRQARTVEPEKRGLLRRMFGRKA